MSRRDHPVLEALGVLALFGALVAIAPGAVLTFAAEHLLHAPLDVGQRWTFAVAGSATTACVMAWRSRSGWDGSGRYMLLAVMTSAALLVARFGVHAAWAAAMLREFVP
ncbi:MAG: hypothetical protein ABI548_21790 [Polyangiaceae bacterium]